MCKYCEFTYVDKNNGEMSNDVKRITRIRNGSYVLDLFIHRYYNGNDCRENELILDSAVELCDGLHTVEERHIKINYCPFCGGEL